MNEENNNFTNMGQPESPTIVPEEAQTVTPVVEQPVTPTVAPEEAAPVTPEVSVTPEVAPATETPAFGTEGPVQSTMPEEVPPVTPMPETPSTSEGYGEPAEPKKNNKVVIIVAAVVILAVVVGIVLCLVLGNKEEENQPVDNTENNTSNEVTGPTEAQTEFLALANKYVEAVKEMWTKEEIVCQDALNQKKTFKPSKLSDKDGYGGPAYYYVFIDTDNSSEVKINVDSTKSVAGWVRINKPNNEYYVALSDGTNYIVEKGYEVNVKYNDLTANDVVTTGNGNNYQYKNGEILGSNTEGNGWGIGDAKVLSDGDDSNDGIYMSNGKKTGGYTPFCTIKK